VEYTSTNGQYPEAILNPSAGLTPVRYNQIQSDTIRYNPENGQVPEYGAAANNRLKAANNRLKVGDATSPSGQHNGNHYPTSSMPPPLTMAAANVRYARNNLGETRRRSQMHGAQWLHGLTLRQ